MATMQIDTSNENSVSNSNVNNNSNNTIEESSPAEFSCRGEALTILSNMLKAMHYGKKKKPQYTKIRIQDVGMSLVCEKAKSMIIRCYLRKDYFQDYVIREPVEFCVELSTLIQVLTIFGTNCEYNIEYKKSTDYLRLLISNFKQASVTECQLFTHAELPEDIPDLQWNEHRIINRMTVQSQYFKDIFNEIDALAKDDHIVWFYIKKGNEDDMNLNMMNNLMDDNDENKNENENENENENIQSSITIGVTSDTLQFQGTVPMSHDLCTSWEFNQNAKYHFRLSLLRPALRAIAKSTIMRINFNEANLIYIQHIFHENQQHGWVEYILLPQSSDFVDDDNDIP
eukprot:215757_1